ncbi:MAG TPA: baseplate J/gp47 family protein [Acidimicrobiales bacterium]|nr:baseplate J/gp47 family protein [Acidimicrobiales bacterium]
MSISNLVRLDATGFHYPDYPTVLEWYRAQYRSIYGEDVYLEPDSQDGQWLAIEARAAHDLMALCASVVNAFSPATAQGVGLSRVVKTNGIKRRSATYSTASLTLVGQVGTVITNGQARDTLGQKWRLPAEVVIPSAGQITVTATAEAIGAVGAAPGSINEIATPTRGWQSVTNAAAAVEGVPVETDAELRRRQSVSTSLPATTPLGALHGALANLDGVSRVRMYENATGATDADGIPAKSICAVVEGGDLDAIAATIGQKKTPGANTHGATSRTYRDPRTGIAYVIKFFELAEDVVDVVINGTALPGYTTKTAEAIRAEVADYINAHEIGEDVEYTGIWAPAYLNGPARLQPYRVDSITLAGGTSDLAIAFNRAAKCAPANVTVNIV